MRRKRIFTRAILLFVIFFLGFVLWFAWNVFPVISGYGSKVLCSAIYLQHRKPADIIREDLGELQYKIAAYTVNGSDSSVTGSVWGFAKKKAIYRKGLGCTLVNDFSEAQIRGQHFIFPEESIMDMDTVPWPLGNKLPGTIPAAVNKDAMNEALEHVFDDTFHGKATHTRGALIVYDGQLVAEKYAPGFDKYTRMPGWSMSKSFIGALIGILVKEGKLNPDAAAPVREWENNDKRKITVKQLLQQTSGLDYAEVYIKPSEASTMLFKRGDMGAYAADLPLKYEPGTVFNYSSGNSNILSRIVRKVVGEKEYPAFLYKSLFHPSGMYSTLLEPDASGTFTGSSYSYATARDFARFGLLYYNNGKVNGMQILPENWVKASIVPSSADPFKQYGYQVWLNGFDKNDFSKHRYPDVPADMFYADGYGGQDIFIIPSKKLVVVRLGLYVIDENKFLKEIIAAIK